MALKADEVRKSFHSFELIDSWRGLNSPLDAGRSNRVVEKKSLTEILKQLQHLPNRTPEMAFSGEAGSAFSDIASYRDGVISVGYYSGNSEWERHPSGDEIVMAIEGSTTLVLLVNGIQHSLSLNPGELVVVPQGHWHRFEASKHLRVMSVTPQPTEHTLEVPGI